MSKSGWIETIIALLISGVLVFFGTTSTKTSTDALSFSKKNSTPKEVYRVYLEGKSIGLLRSKQELEDYIDQEQSKIKEKYHVEKVYIPNDLDIVKEITYDEELSTSAEIYRRIKEIKGIESFTINGYKITIEGIDEETEEGTVEVPDQTIYVLDRTIFEGAVDKTIRAFIDGDEYEKFLAGTQTPITDVGKIIEDLYIKNSIKISEEKIPTGAKIYTSTEELSKYLLFGTTEDQQQYTVKMGDTIENVSFDNKLSPEEFLIANPTFKTAEDLLFPGQEVILGIVKPQFKVIEEDHVVERKEVEYGTKYENDNTQYVGYEKVKQEGQNGIQIITSKVQKNNGQIVNYIPVGTAVEVKPTVDKIIVRGTKRYQSSGTTVDGEVTVPVGSWVWPTNRPYQISSGFGWRWGKFHEGLDITGPGRGSPIYAANNGLVVQSGYTSINGNYITIKHSNGYYTSYAHMTTRYKSVGETVYAGDRIGAMGDTGYAFGVHLHFAVFRGMPYRGGTPINPYSVVR